MSAQPAVVPTSAHAATTVPGHLFVSTALDTWFTEHAAAFARDVQIDDIAYGAWILNTTLGCGPE